MSRYDGLTWYSEERKTHYEKINNSSSKMKGDFGEALAIKLFENSGWEVRRASPSEDAQLHIDLWIRRAGTDDPWTSVDVKYKKSFTLELVNRWGKKGWLYTGADMILQIMHDNPSIPDGYYLYSRTAMVEYVARNPGLFQDKYCVHYDGATLWNVGVKRLNEMNFITKLA